MRPARRREAVDRMRATWRVSIRRACSVLQAERSSYHYKGKRRPQAVLNKRIKEIAETRVRYGYRRIHVLLRREGWRVNAKRVNGPEFVSKELDLWAFMRGVTLDFSRPGKPTDNAYIESFNGKFRSECLNANWFLCLDEARQKCEAWRRDYNECVRIAHSAAKRRKSFIPGSATPSRG
jgi:transposase InsO family protein